MNVVVILLILFFLLLLVMYILQEYNRHKEVFVDEIFIEHISGPLKNKKSIVVIAIVKNEEMVIEEWLNHYRWQGIEHFYIIDNASTDQTYSILSSQRDVTLFFGNEKGQIRYYNTVFNKIKDQTEWVIVVDSDEYVYGRNGLKIRDYLLSTSYDAIILSWKMFTSNGFVKQPPFIRKSFIRRRTKLNRSDMYRKTIVRAKAVKSLGVHVHNFVGNSVTNPKELALNHYAIMSLEYFQKVKMARGSVHYVIDKNHKNVRTMEYFHKYDQGDTDDTELRDLVIDHEREGN